MKKILGIILASTLIGCADIAPRKPVPKPRKLVSKPVVIRFKAKPQPSLLKREAALMFDSKEAFVIERPAVAPVSTHTIFLSPLQRELLKQRLKTEKKTKKIPAKKSGTKKVSFWSQEEIDPQWSTPVHYFQKTSRNAFITNIREKAQLPIDGRLLIKTVKLRASVSSDVRDILKIFDLSKHSISVNGKNYVLENPVLKGHELIYQTAIPYESNDSIDISLAPRNGSIQLTKPTPIKVVLELGRNNTI